MLEGAHCFQLYARKKRGNTHTSKKIKKKKNHWSIYPCGMIKNDFLKIVSQVITEKSWEKLHTKHNIEQNTRQGVALFTVFSLGSLSAASHLYD